jgi:hypothetical protein
MPSDEQPIRILHLGDFHLSPRRRWDADPVLSGLTGRAATVGRELDTRRDRRHR